MCLSGRGERAGRRLLAVAAAGVAALAVAAPAGAAPVHWTDLPAGANPWAITAGPDGSVWFTERGRSTIGTIDGDGHLTEYTDGVSGAAMGIAAGSDGNLWFTEPYQDRIGRITPDGHVTEFPLGPPHTARPTEITAGPDGALWFIETDLGRIGRITTDGDISTFSIEGEPPGWGADPLGITSGGDGRIWFTDAVYPYSVDAMTTSGTVTRYHLPDGVFSGPGIATAPDGDVVFTTGIGGGQSPVYEVSPDGALTDRGHLMPTEDLATDDAGDIWATEPHNQLGRVTENGADELDGGLPWIDDPDPMEQEKLDLQGIAKAGEGDIWLTDPFGDRIGRFDPSDPPGPADLAGPQIHITTPSDLEHIDQGSTALQDYSCADDLSGVRSCTSESTITPVDPRLLSCDTLSDMGYDLGPLGEMAGDPLDTAEPGRHTFLVKAYDHAGHITCQRRFYEVDAAPEGNPPPSRHPGAGGPAPPTRAAMGAALHRGAVKAAKRLRRHGLRRLQRRHVTAGTAKALAKGGLTATLTRRAHGHTTVLARFHHAYAKAGHRALRLTTTRAGRRLARRQARRHGRLRVTVDVRFKPSGAKALSRRARVTLKR
jgi:virginiamycin B lyase